MTVPSTARAPLSAWIAAVRLIERWFATPERIDRLMEELPPELGTAERARCQHLVFGVVRHAGRLETALSRLIAHPPRFVTRAVLFVAGFELIENLSAARNGDQAEDRSAQIVHHAVERAKSLASPAEARLVNAVVRKLAAELAGEAPPARLASAEDLAAYFSHPIWLVKRWLTAHGAQATRSFLEWNQRPAPVYARSRGTAALDWLKATAWPGFYEVPSGRWADVEPLLKAGHIYLQDPGTRFAVELLAPVPGEAILDLCASPGGKSLMIADLICKTANPASLLVCLDLPGERIGRLRENLSVVAGLKSAVVEADLLDGAARILQEQQLPSAYPAVLLDVPCSNTGVMRHRIDVKWRLQEADFRRQGRQQLALLEASARLVAPGGRLVYSTCSIDPEENEQVVAAFLKRAGDFTLEAQMISTPWVSGHDGAAAFRLRRASLTAPARPPSAA